MNLEKIISYINEEVISKTEESKDIPGYGSHHHPWRSNLEWLVKFRNPFGEYGAINWEPTFLSNELEFYALATLTFIHAYRHGGRYMWLWWTTVAHGLMTELVSYWAEPIDNFWHAQSMFMWFGQREPFSIMCLYPGYIYTASIAVSRLGLTERCEAAGMGLFVLLFDLPYDIMGIKLLWWTWHDTDSNIRDRMYWVPWTSYYFHMTFACAFNLINNWARRHFVGISGLYSEDEIQRMPFAQRQVALNWWGEFKALAVTGMCAMPFGIMQFVPGYHIFKDVFHVHAEVTTCFLAAIYAVILFYGLNHGRRHNYLEHGERELLKGDKKGGEGKWYYDTCFMAVCMHYFHYMVLVIFANPKTNQVLGVHQPMGDAPGSDSPYACDSYRNLTYPYPFTKAGFPPIEPFNWDIFPNVTVWKRPYFCEGGYLLDEKVMDYSCEMARKQKWLGKGHDWFWICGTDWDNGDGSTSHVEYILVIWGLCLLGLNVYAQAYCYPRTLWEQFVVLKEFPKYYKTNQPEFLVKSIEGRRVNAKGVEEYLVKKVPYNANTIADVITGTETVWEAKTSLVQDAIGPVYAERGGQYGQFYDSYGGSTRERLRVFDELTSATDRLNIYEGLRSRPKIGFKYENGRRVPLTDDIHSLVAPRNEDSSSSNGNHSQQNGTKKRT